MEETTGYYIDIPVNGSVVDEVNSATVGLSIATYGASGAATVVEETSTHQGTIEWDATIEIMSVTISGTPVEIVELVGGKHAPQRPK